MTPQFKTINNRNVFRINPKPPVDKQPELFPKKISKPFNIFLAIFRDTNKYPFIWTILFLIILLTLMNIHTLVDIESVTMILVNFLVKSFIPTIPIIVFNAILYKRLKALLNSGSFNFRCNSELQKSVFRAKVTILIAFIFVSSQILLWIQIFIILVCTFHGNFQICHFVFTF